MADGDNLPRPVIQGFLQALLPLRVRGWAWLPSRPETHLRIEVRVDGAVVAKAVAKTIFADLRKQKIGDGDHGFLIDLESDLPVEQRDRIEVVALGPAGEQRMLQLSVVARVRAGLPAGPTLAPAAAAPTPQEPSPADGRLRLARFTPTDRAQRPVFVLGSARSGTTALVHALRATGRYAAFGEGHFLPLFAALESVVATHYGRSIRDAAPGMNTFIAHVSPHTVMDAIQNGFVEIVRETFPDGHWLDKTPGPDMIKIAPAMRRIWPQARFIFMKRHPIDNIESRRRKFPSISFADHCRLWAECMMAWLMVRGELGEAGLELDQAQLAFEPEESANRIGAMLNLSQAEQARVRASLTTERPQQTGDGADTPSTLASVGWTHTQCAAFADCCAAAIRAFGYEVDLADAAADRPPSDLASRRNPATC